MARLNISVPDELKEKMDAVGDKVNWSGVAQSAFNHAISTYSFPRSPSMEDVIARLKASKEEEEAKLFKRGQQEGREWAMKTATYSQLHRISNVHLGEVSATGMSFAQAVDRIINFDNDNELGHGLFFWDEAGIRSTDEYVDGFVAGAAEVWAQVKDKI